MDPTAEYVLNGQFYTSWTYLVEMDFERILKTHYFIVRLASSPSERKEHNNQNMYVMQLYLVNIAQRLFFELE